MVPFGFDANDGIVLLVHGVHFADVLEGDRAPGTPSPPCGSGSLASSASLLPLLLGLGAAARERGAEAELPARDGRVGRAGFNPPLWV